MAKVFVTLRVMPESVDIDLTKIENNIKNKIKDFGGDVAKIETEPVAFGLKALKIIFLLDEQKSNLDPLEEDVKTVDGVQSADVVDVRRAVG